MSVMSANHILIVEDEAAHAELMRRSFEYAEDDYRVSVVSNIAEARESLAEATPDLMIADLMLPDGRSIELLPEGDGLSGEYPVVVMTSHGDESVAVEAMKAGALDYIVKSEDVFRTIPHVADRALREWRQRDQLQQTQAELRRMSKVFLDAADPILIEDLDWNIVDANREALAFYGATREELIGRSVQSLVPDGDRDEARELFDRCLAGEEIRNVETRRVDSEGRVYTVLLTLSRLTDEAGESTGVATIPKDITERKRLEREFRQAQKMEAVGTLTSGIAHDFNNLLMGIMGCADIALGRLAGGQPASQYVREIKEAADRGASLTQQLLAFSRKGDAQLQVVDFNETVAASRAMLSPLVGEDVTIEFETASRDLRVECNRGEMEQVLVNLVVNARDAMPEGGTVRIETAAVSFEEGDERLHGGLEPGDYATLSVSDTGTGIEPEALRQIFDPFFTTKDVGEGTGLGLSTVYGIVNQWGGELDVDTELGEGTTFTLYIPRVYGELEERGEATESRSHDGDATILVVEDESLVRMTVRGYLEDAGYRVHDAADGDAAERVFEEAGEAIDLVVTDVVLPGTKGGELAARLRERRAGPPVLFMSAYAAEKLEADGQVAATEQVLQKPFPEERLLEKVAGLLDGERSEPEEEAETEVPESGGADPRGGPTVLLVEDNRLARMATGQLLGDEGFEVLEAESGTEARAVVEKYGLPDVLLTDINLPDVGGVELAEQMRAEAEDVRVIFVSGGGREEVGLGDALETPGTAFMQKPLDIGQLAATIRTL